MRRYRRLRKGKANAAPTCTIEAPTNGDSTPEGEAVQFEATVGDANVPPNWLTVNSESNIDGPLGDSSPAADGSVSLTAAALSDRILASETPTTSSP